MRDSRGVCVECTIRTMNAITQYLSDDERPFWLFPFGEIVASSGVRLHLDADKDAPEEGKLTRATALQSLRDWVAHYRPPMLREHERDGRAHGEIVRVIEVTQAQAAEWGVEQRGDAVWGVARLRGQMLADYDDGLLRTTSPHLAMSYTDDEGTVWPLAMLELSAVSDPRQKGRQVTTDRLSGVRLSESEPRITITQTHEVQMGEEYEARLASCESKLADIEEAMGEMKSMLGQLMEGASEEEESEEMADGNPEEEMSDKPRAEQAIIAKLAQENAALAERVKAVEQERAQERASALVEAAYSERTLDPAKRGEYMELALKDSALFELAISAAPKHTRKVGSTVGTGVVAKGAPGSAERFEELMAEHGDAAKAHAAWLKEAC